MRRRRKKGLSHLVLTVAILLFLSGGPGAETIVLKGSMDGEFEILQERRFPIPPEGLKTLSFRFANPGEYSTRALSQTLSDYTLTYSPKPHAIRKERDRFGNTFTIITWKNPKEMVTVKETYTANLTINLKEMRSSAPFPLDITRIPEKERVFLRGSKLVQVDSPEIVRLSRELTSSATSEQTAVMGILNWVVDNIKYRTPVPRYDALWTLRTGHGNCQNFSHLSIALLRASGIPARIVGGISLGRQWKVPLKRGALLQSIGQGGHAWIEVWYPDIGWIPYDVQQSHLFVSPRHIKQTVGIDSTDINDTWRASPVLPPFNEEISADYRKDTIELTLVDTLPGPSNYIMTTTGIKPPVVEPEKAPEKKPTPLEKGKRVIFGNMDFPSLMNFYVSGEGGGQKTFDKETAEYVTSRYTYAQAFTVGQTIEIETISLAMHRFGGRFGSLWIDVVEDRDGRPGVMGIRSYPLSLDSIKYHPGYKWFDFVFSRDTEERPVLKPGKYWIILRHSRDAIVNWFYTPGNQYGSVDDTRSTTKGIDWSDILNYDFNFKVTGIVSG